MSGRAPEELSSYATTADPYRAAPADLADLQLAAAREIFAERRQQIPVLDKRARETGVDEIEGFGDLVPLLFAHTNYKSYPESFVDAGQWANMNMWLGTLSSESTSNIDVDGVQDADDWLERAWAAGHMVFASSGTSGKSSFMNQTRHEQEVWIEACAMGHDLMAAPHVPGQRHVVFATFPARGFHKFCPFGPSYWQRWAIPGEIHQLSDDPLRAFDAMRPAQLRRLLAAGRIGPGEVAAFEDAMAARQVRRAAEMDAFLDKIYDCRDRPMVLALMWPNAWQIVESLKARGVEAGSFHPDTIMALGGGTKGASLPSDFKQQISAYFGLTPDRVIESYSMSEVNGLCPKVPGTASYATPPWLIPLVLDKSGERLLNPEDGTGVVEGRMAFFDATAEGHWGGIISGDKVVVEFGSGVDGTRVPIIHSIARYAELEEGEDKLTCAGSIDSYVRGTIAGEPVGAGT